MPGPPPMVMLGIDPGKMTGLAWWQQDAGHHADEWSFEPAGDYIIRTAEMFGRGAHLICERYTIDTGRPQDDANHAIEMIGIARRAALKNGCTLHEPVPGDRLIATPQMLVKLGWWRPGKKDANAANQHLLAYQLTHRGCLPSAVREVILSEAVRTLP